MIRKMKRSDITAILAIETKAFHQPWTQEQFQYEMEDNVFAHLYVLEEGNEISGYLDYWVTFETAQLAKIAVAPQVTRQGIASKLMDFLITECDAAMCENISLEVRTHNLAANQLYEKYGFIEATIRKKYYQDGEDARLMIKPLGGSFV